MSIVVMTTIGLLPKKESAIVSQHAADGYTSSVDMCEASTPSSYLLIRLHN